MIIYIQMSSNGCNGCHSCCRQYSSQKKKPVLFVNNDQQLNGFVPKTSMEKNLGYNSSKKVGIMRGNDESSYFTR